MNRGSLRLIRSRVDTAMQAIEPVCKEANALGDARLAEQLARARAMLLVASQRVDQLLALTPSAAAALPTSSKQEDKHGTAHSDY